MFADSLRSWPGELGIGPEGITYNVGGLARILKYCVRAADLCIRVKSCGVDSCDLAWWATDEHVRSTACVEGVPVTGLDYTLVAAWVEPRAYDMLQDLEDKILGMR